MAHAIRLKNPAGENGIPRPGRRALTRSRSSNGDAMKWAALTTHETEKSGQFQRTNLKARDVSAAATHRPTALQPPK